MADHPENRKYHQGDEGRKLCIIKAGATFPELAEKHGDFEVWISKGLGLDNRLIQVVNAEKSAPLPEPEKTLGAVISGSHAMVTQDLEWSLNLEVWTRNMVAAGRPLLGICYGHQVIAKAMGGKVDFHPKGTEVGTKEIACKKICAEDELFKTLPLKFKANLFHSQSVTRLPPGAVLLAQNDYDPHQAFRIGKNAWGVQFHPEAAEEIIKGYINGLSQTLKEEGQDPDAIMAAMGATPNAAALLRRFGELACTI